MSRGVLNEVYYPTVDRPQIRDLQYLITDGKTFVHDERRHLKSTSEYIDRHSLGVRVTSVDPEGRYRLEKEIVTNPDQACVLIRTLVTVLDTSLETLRLFALLAPHLDGGGDGNSGYVAVQGGREVLVAHKGAIWLALAATAPFLRPSCGSVGRTAGPIWPRTTKWTGNLTPPWTGTSRSAVSWILPAATSSCWDWPLGTRSTMR